MPISPHFSLRFFHLLFTFMLFSPQYWHQKSRYTISPPPCKLWAHLNPVLAKDMAIGCWLDSLVDTLLAGKTDINILPLTCPYSSLQKHNGVARGAEKLRGWERRRGKKTEGGACHSLVCVVRFTGLLDFRLTWITAQRRYYSLTEWQNKWDTSPGLCVCVWAREREKEKVRGMRIRIGDIFKCL